MPNRGTLSILGLYWADDSIFDDMYVPDSVDPSLVIANILDQCSELECIYPDAEYMKYSISLWSYAEGSTWDRLAELDGLDYNPIENYDRIETESTGRDKRRTMTEKSSGISHSDQESSQENTENSNTAGSSAHNVTGYNTNTPVTDNTDNNAESTSKSGSVSGSVKGNTGSSSETQGSEGEQENLVKQSRIHGNIGVKSAQQMIRESIELAPQLNLVNYITESFKLRFCVMVY